jgi:2-iminobutanoate/2-iminopropanoate deaminase
MDKQVIVSKNAPAPVGPYSQAIVAGEFIFCSGQIALDPKTGEISGGDIENQTARIMENLRAVLEEAGSSLDRVVKTTVFLSDMQEFARMNAVYGSFFGENPPARSTVPVNALPRGARVEIECIAAK